MTKPKAERGISTKRVYAHVAAPKRRDGCLSPAEINALMQTWRPKPVPEIFPGTYKALNRLRF